MSHIFTLDDLARCKVSFDFANPGQPSSINWQPRIQAVSVPTSSQTLSIRVDESFVNGRPCLTLFLVHDPESVSLKQKPVETFAEALPSPFIPPETSVNEISHQNSTKTERTRSISTTSSSSESSLAYSDSPETQLSFGFSPLDLCEPWELASNPAQDSAQLFAGSHSPEVVFPPNLSSNDEILDDTSLLSSLMSLDMFFGSKSGSADLSLTGIPVFSSTFSPVEFGSESGQSDHSSPEVISTSSPAIQQEKDAHDRRLRGGRSARQSNNGCARNHPPDCNCGAVHSRTATQKKKRVQCSLCEETFSRRHDMMRHESSQHGKVQDWTCDKCRRFFSSEAMLMVHKCPAFR